MMTEIELLEHVLGNLKAGNIAGYGLVYDDGRLCTAKNLYHIACHDPDALQLAPRTHIVNTFEVPAPESEAPEKGQDVFIPDHGLSKGCAVFYWEDVPMHRRFLKNKQVFLTKEAAILNQKAQAGVEPYKGGDE